MTDFDHRWRTTTTTKKKKTMMRKKMTTTCSSLETSPRQILAPGCRTAKKIP
jgi:hypothetical protein